MKNNQIIAIAACLVLAGCTGSGAAAASSAVPSSTPEPTPAATAAETDFSKFSMDNEGTYITALETFVMTNVGDNSVIFPDPSSSDWSFVDFDGDDDGKVCSVMPVTVNGQQYQLTAVFSTDGQQVNGHYLAIDTQLFIDDGSCDATMGALGMPTLDNH